MSVSNQDAFSDDSQESQQQLPPPDQQLRGTDDSKDNPSASSSPQSTPSAEDLRLRSGTILQGPTNSVVSLDSYLNFLNCKARESGVSVSQCDALDKKLVQTREQRLAQIKKFKRETERFKRELLDFNRFSRSVISEDHLNISSDSVKLLNISEAKSEPSAGEVVLSWLSDSLFESSPEEDYNPNFNVPKFPINTDMAVDYSKVVKLASQMVPLFSGAPHPQLSQELQTFLGCCKQVENCLEEEEKVAFLQILPTRLRGEAYQLVTSSSWAKLEDFENLLNGTYLPRETYQELVNRLITCRQTTTENFNMFAQRVKQLLGQCKQAAEAKYSTAGAKAIKPQLEDFAKTAIKTGAINPHLSAYLLGQTDASLESIIQKALDMERLQMGHPHFYVYGGQPLPNTFTSSQPSSLPANPYTTPVLNPYQVPQNTQVTTTAEIQSHLSVTPATQPISPASAPLNTKAVQAVPTSQTTKSSAMLSRITCSYCNVKGHTYDECLKRKNTPFCNICKMQNHDASDCRRNRPNYPQQPPQSRNNYQSNSTQQPHHRNNNYPSNLNPQPQNRGGNYSGPPRANQMRSNCQFCGRRGHTVNNCRQKQRWEARGNPQQSTENPPARL